MLILFKIFFIFLLFLILNSVNIGIPEVWTEHEEALKNDLKIVLLEIKKNLQHTDNILNNNSYLSDFSVLNSQGHLSQNVRDDINSNFFL